MARLPGQHDDSHHAAALTIQRHYRGYQARKVAKRLKLKNEGRWDELLKQSEEKIYADEQLNNRNDVHSRWKRAYHAAKRLQTGRGVHDHQTQLKSRSAFDGLNLSEEEKRKILHKRRAKFMGSLSLGVGDVVGNSKALEYQSKALEQQHWLEMIDWKHRYGSNMKYYFRKWKESEKTDNFFRWLDRGEGKDLDLEELPRERLEREKITYLSAEKRLNYLVNVDRDGKLRWAWNNALVDTASGRWQDVGDGNGIVPMHLTANAEDTAGSWDSESTSDASSIESASSASYSAGSDLDDNEATHYAGLDEREEQNGLSEKTHTITPNGIRKALLRKTVRRNTWIYVSDMRMNLFIGIKDTGIFQHSSFLAGGKVTSAGLIVVKKGVIKSLNPHSGHYRSSIDNYRSFIRQLEEKGVDLSHVKIAKSVLSLWGLSKYAAATKTQKDLSSRLKAALHLPHPPTEMEKSEETKRNAQAYEEEHQERVKELNEAERGKHGEERMDARMEVLYGDGASLQEDSQEGTDGRQQSSQREAG